MASSTTGATSATAAPVKQSVPTQAAAFIASTVAPDDAVGLVSVMEGSATRNTADVEPEAAAKSVASQALTNDANPARLASMLDLRDVLRLSLLCKEMGASFGRRARKTCLTKGAGVPQDRRIEFWMCMLNVEKASILLIDSK